MAHPTMQTVALVQTRLRAKTGVDLKADGREGSHTRAEVTKLQVDTGAPATGRVGDALPLLVPGLRMDANGDPAWNDFYGTLFGDHYARPISEPVPGTHGAFLPEGIVVHHTAGGRDTPPDFLKKGRPGVSGPLYCFAANRDGTLDAISNGRTHNAGQGDVRVLDRLTAGRLQRPPGEDSVSGNGHFYGCVLEHSGDFNEPVVAAARQRLVEVCAMWCFAWGWSPAHRVIGHKEWTRRKSDPIFDMDPFRADVVRVFDGLRSSNGGRCHECGALLPGERG